MKIYDILDIAELERHIQEGYVTRRTHPHLPLAVLNYTPKAQYESLWNDITIRCRGLIVDDKGDVVSNCMKKFFNYGQKEIDTSGPVQVTDKLDGSLGSVSFYGGELVVSTRGSFESDQAKFAYNLIKNNTEYYNAFKILCSANVTAIVEIIYPDNRIVVDYYGMEDVILIGALGNYELHGKQLWLPADRVYSWPGPTVHKFCVDSFEDALLLPPRKNAEGIVIYFENSGERLKIKQEDYIEAHKFIFNLTPKAIWESLSQGKTLEDLLTIAPDEFHPLVRSLVESLLDKGEKVIEQAKIDFNKIKETLGDDFTRRDFAVQARQYKHSDLLYSLLDGHEDRMLGSVWKTVRPRQGDR